MIKIDFNIQNTSNDENNIRNKALVNIIYKTLRPCYTNI